METDPMIGILRRRARLADQLVRRLRDYVDQYRRYGGHLSVRCSAVAEQLEVLVRDAEDAEVRRG
jgi:hypothetical protein